MVRIAAFLFVMFSTFSIVGFYMPPYLQYRGLDAGEIGMLMGLGSMMAMFAQPFWGYVSDKRKTVRRILLLLIGSCVLVSIGFFAAEHALLIMACYLAFMFFNSATGPLSETLCLSHAQERGKEFGRLRLWGELGIGCSSLAAGFIVKAIGIDRLSVIYLTLALLAFAAALLLRDSKITPAPVDLKALGRLFKQPRLLWLLLLILLVGIPHRMNDSLLALYLEELHATESQLGMAWFVATISTVPALFFAGKLIRRWNELGILAVAAALYGIRWAVYSLADSAAVLIAAQALHSVTFPLFLVAAIQYLAALVPGELRATGQAAFAVTFGGIGGLIGNAGGGYAIERLGAAAAYGFGSVLALVGAAAIVATYWYNRRMDSRPAAREAGMQRSESVNSR